MTNHWSNEPPQRQALHQDGKHHYGIGNGNDRLTLRAHGKGEGKGYGDTPTQPALGENLHHVWAESAA